MGKQAEKRKAAAELAVVAKKPKSAKPTPAPTKAAPANQNGSGSKGVQKPHKAKDPCASSAPGPSGVKPTPKAKDTAKKTPEPCVETRPKAHISANGKALRIPQSALRYETSKDGPFWTIPLEVLNKDLKKCGFGPLAKAETQESTLARQLEDRVLTVLTTVMDGVERRLKGGPVEDVVDNAGGDEEEIPVEYERDSEDGTKK